MRATRSLAGFLKPYLVWATLAPLLMALEVSMDLLQPRLIARLIDSGIGQGDRGVHVQTAIWMLAAAIVGFLIAKGGPFVDKPIDKSSTAADDGGDV